MMYKRLFVVLLAATQLSVPVFMIGSKEKILHKGEVFYFKTAPVDPYDIFRGRFVAVNVDPQYSFFRPKNIEGYFHEQTIYVALDRDRQGFALIRDVSTKPPTEQAYIKTRVTFLSHDQTVNYALPFDRFYMNEKKAKRAEELYRQHSSAGKRDAYIVARILDGKAVIQDLVIGGKPISTYF